MPKCGKFSRTATRKPNPPFDFGSARPLSLAADMIRTLTLSALLMIAFVFQAVAADVTGKWKGNFAEGGDIVFDLKVDGDMLTGTMTGADGKTFPISKATLKDDAIAFTVQSEYQGAPITVLLKGRLTAPDSIKVTMQTEDGSWSTDTTITKQAAGA